FIVHKKERLVFDDRAAQRSRPLIRVVERLLVRLRRGLRQLGLFMEPAIGIQYSAIPEIIYPSMKSIGPGLGHVIYIGPGQATVLRRVTVVHHRDFLNVVLTNQQIGSAG